MIEVKNVLPCFVYHDGVCGCMFMYYTVYLSVYVVCLNFSSCVCLTLIALSHIAYGEEMNYDKIL